MSTKEHKAKNPKNGEKEWFDRKVQKMDELRARIAREFAQENLSPSSQVAA